MVSAANAFAANHSFRKLLLVGYSGGGTLVTLMAPHMPAVVGVVTIAANLDTDAWTRLHGYVLLTDSLNPSAEPPLPNHIREWHFVGGRDTNVPYAAAERYLERVPRDRVVTYPSFDHVCCWEQEWPAILSRVVPGELPVVRGD
jgi:pimeloyl-ACP methyl ester carboxylesterase